MRILIVSWSCFEDWDGFSPWTKVCVRPPVCAGAVAALPPLRGLVAEQPARESDRRVKMVRTCILIFVFIFMNFHIPIVMRKRVSGKKCAK